MEEDNGRQKWLIGEKDKEIETIKEKFTDTYQYSLEERLQESTEALEVAANLQGEQLQYLEDHALKVLAKERKVGRFGVPVGDVGIAPSANERTFDGIIGTKRRDSGVNFVFVGWVLEEENERDCRRTTVSSLTGRLAWLGKNLKPVSSALSNALMACASPPGGLPREGDAIDANKNNSASGESTEKTKIRKRRRRVAIAKKAKRKEMWKQLRPTEEVEPENKARAKNKNTKNPR